MSRTPVAQQTRGVKRGGAGGKRPVRVDFALEQALCEYVGGDEEAEEHDQRGGDEQLGSEATGAMVVDLRARGAADRAAPLDNRAGAMCADQVLTAHLVTPSGSGAPAHLE